MVRVNLTPGFEPFGAGLPVNVFTFPSGMEPHVKITRPEETLHSVREMDFLITIRMTSAADIILLMLANDALRRMGAVSISAFIPFLPFARQDRVMVKGEPFSLKVLTTLLNDCFFDKIYTYDVHSDVALALLDNAVNADNGALISAVVGEKRYSIVTPDAGAQKKIYKVLQGVANKPDEVIAASKARNLATGEIGNMSLPAFDFVGRNVYVVDDICDGGATFLPLGAKLLLAGAESVQLIVTHGIFSKGTEGLLTAFDTIHCSNSIRDNTPGVVTHKISGAEWISI